MKKSFVLFFVLFSLFPLFGDGEDEVGDARRLHDGVLGIDYLLESSHSLESPVLRVDLFKKPGTFNIRAKTDGSRAVPLLATQDVSSSTSFLLRIDGKIYSLRDLGRIPRELRTYEDGAQLVYFLDDQIRFIVDFSLAGGGSGHDHDIVRVTLRTVNLGSRSHSVDVKGIFDTVCGEVSSVHFTAGKRSEIRFETRLSASDVMRERTVVSSNGRAAFQFVFDGNSVTPVESVIFANPDILYKAGWTPDVRKGRGFSNIRGYDDSAIMVDWNEFRLEPNEKSEITFFIAVAVNDAPLRGLDYVDRIIMTENKKKDEVVAAPPPLPAQDKRSGVEFIVPPVKDYQLDPEYIQNLIDRIDSLQSGDNVDKKEIERLNAELDAILEKLRRR